MPPGRGGDVGSQAGGADDLGPDHDRRLGVLVADGEVEVGDRADLGGGLEADGELLLVDGGADLGDEVAEVGAGLGAEDEPTVAPGPSSRAAPGLMPWPSSSTAKTLDAGVGHGAVGRRAGGTGGGAGAGHHHDVGLVAVLVGEVVAGQGDGAPHRRLVVLTGVGRGRDPLDGGDDAGGVAGEALDLVGRGVRGVDADELVGLLRLGPALDPAHGGFLGRHEGAAAVHGVGGVEHQGHGDLAALGEDLRGVAGDLVAVVGDQRPPDVGGVAGVEELQRRASRGRWCRPDGSAGRRRRPRRRRW